MKPKTPLSDKEVLKEVLKEGNEWIDQEMYKLTGWVK